MGIVRRHWKTERQGGAKASGDVEASGECTRGDGEQRQERYVGDGAESGEGQVSPPVDSGWRPNRWAGSLASRNGVGCERRWPGLRQGDR